MAQPAIAPPSDHDHIVVVRNATWADYQRHLENEDADRGVEPDECYVVGDVPEPALPDLAIEVVWTSGGVDKLEVYRKLGVREVWIYEKAAFRLFALDGDRYRPIDGSVVLAGIDRHQLAEHTPMQPMTRAVRAYRQALRGDG